VAVEAGATHTLLDVRGSGVVTRIWLTIPDRSPAMLRALRLDMFWDGATKPAVSVPLGAFFGIAVGELSAFHNAFFASPEGRSFVCLIPMPFKTGAKIVLVNESGQTIDHLFYDVDFQSLHRWNPNNLYFHATWHRDTATTPGTDFELLPPVRGRGRFLGVNLGINVNPVYRGSWWGEGEVHVYLDGDTHHPSLAGTGTEDYFWSGWGQGTYVLPYVGCLTAGEHGPRWGCYRYHVPDPIFFRTQCRVTLQQIGGTQAANVRAMQAEHLPLIPVSVDSAGQLIPLFTPGTSVSLAQTKVPSTGWLNFYRSDDVAATAYFYLATPTNNAPPLQPVAMRIFHLGKME
jgi:hypothetical protein